MFFDDYLREDAETETNDIDQLLPQDPDTEAGIEAMADQVEDALQAQALESADYFENGEEAVQAYIESAEIQAYQEAFPFGGAMKKKTFVKLNKRDDLKRRARLASLIIAKEKKDPLFDKLAKNRIRERMLRKQIFRKYGKQAYKVAKASQKKHAAEQKKFPLPIFNKKADPNGNKIPSYNQIFSSKMDGSHK